MASSDEGEAALTRHLLVELLAYQFAFPVRWIETQEHILKSAGNAQRVIEIGPSQVLTPMIRKTATKDFAAYDQTHSVQREFLSYNNDVDKIFYNYPQPKASNSNPHSIAEAPKSTPTSTSTLSPTITIPATPLDSSTTKTSPSVNDKPLTATDIVVALTSQKLKRPFDELKLTDSIRGLSGGRSTFQNELVGDLAAEFDEVPNGAEDLSLEALSSTLAKSFSGNPGKQMGSIISKLISSKMPAGFNLNAMKSHLESYWGLPRQRQIAVVCFATTIEPPGRFGDEDSAKEWLDLVVMKYSRYFSLNLAPDQSSALSAALDVVGPVDAKSLEVARKEQRKIMHAQFTALKKYLQDDEDSNTGQLSEIVASLELCETKLFQWGIEFDDNFFNGIVPIFDAYKARYYDSWWNWAREDTITLLHGIAAGKFDLESSETVALFSKIQNRQDKACEEIFNYHAKSLQSSRLEVLAHHSILSSNTGPRFRYQLPSLAPVTEISDNDELRYRESPRTEPDGITMRLYSRIIRMGSSQIQPSFAHLRTRYNGKWIFDEEHTVNFMDVLDLGMNEGFTFKDKTVLVTGAGPDSIGAEIVKGLLTGGASVIVTTSRAPSNSASFYQNMYRGYAGNGATLKVLPFNAGSRSDCERLIEYVYGPDSGVADLDFIVPFAAIPQVGQIDSLSSQSELAHRAMLVNLIRLLGHVKKIKIDRGYLMRPTNVLLPLSPNHGTFGGDGLYGESKLGLESLLNRGLSEDWNAVVTITGVVIGWTRGTGLMSVNNTVAYSIESHGVMTFSQAEMAFNILALMSPEISMLSEDGPIYADLSGGLHELHDLKKTISESRQGMLDEIQLRKAIKEEDEYQISIINGPSVNSEANLPARARTRLVLDFPNLKPYEQEIEDVLDLEGMLDLDRVIVTVGYSELGPWGSARTRWEIERSACLTKAGLIEMAWIMGLVTRHDGHHEGARYVGWIDAETLKPVHDDEFKDRYERKIMTHSGLRFIEPEGLQGYDPSKKEILQEIVLDEDLPPFEASKTTSEAFVRKHGESCHLEPIVGSEDYKVHIKKGATFWIPKAVQADRFVAGQLPKGWNPARYGIPQDVISQVDPVVIYALCCLSEAVLMAGLQDPLELYQYIHVSELANCLGTGAGPLLAMRGIYRDRFLDRPVQNDMLQESYLNAIGAWSNMLLMASAGPIRSPTGTCATSVESLDAGCEAIKAGKAKVAIVGGSDDFEEEMSYEFGNMKATANTREELRRGRLPSEMSRPTTTSRAGFVESAGCGVQIIMTADLALRMGLPVYGIVGYTHLAGDKVGRSVPAPGQGLLTAAKETREALESPLLDLDYRREMLQHQLSTIAMSQKAQMRVISKRGGNATQLASVEKSAIAAAKDARNVWSNDIRKQDPDISPIRAALAVWGLTIDDIQVASFHGTSTVANDKNESDVVNTQMRHLGRSRGNPLLVIAQKYLTGHTKGAAGAFMMNGGLQMLSSGMIPGNRNADNIDAQLKQFEHLVFPSKTIQTAGIKSFMLTSFGFGQKGGLVIMIHPRYLFATVNEQIYEHYRKQVAQRQTVANARFVRGIKENNLFRAKDKSPWEAAGEQKVFLDPTARISGNDPFQLQFDSKDLHPEALNAKAVLTPPVMKSDPAAVDPSSSFQSFIHESLQGEDVGGIGVDIEELSAIPVDNSNFVSRNFTKKEQLYCRRANDVHASLAGRWVAKEAIFKSLQTRSRGAGAVMDEIEVLPDTEGIPRVTLHGEAARAAKRRDIGRVEVSISHSEGSVMAAAVAVKHPASPSSSKLPESPASRSASLAGDLDLRTLMNL